MPYRQQPTASREVLHLRRVVLADRRIFALAGLVLLLVGFALTMPARATIWCDVHGTCKVEAVSLAGVHDDQRVEWNQALSGAGSDGSRGLPVIEPEGHGLPLFGEVESWTWGALRWFSLPGGDTAVLAAGSEQPVMVVQKWCLATPVGLLLVALLGVPGLFLWFGAAFISVRAEIEGGILKLQASGRGIGRRVTSIAATDVAAIEAREAPDAHEPRICTVLEVVTIDGARRSLFERDLSRSRGARHLARELGAWVYKTEKTALA